MGIECAARDKREDSFTQPGGRGSSPVRLLHTQMSTVPGPGQRSHVLAPVPILVTLRTRQVSLMAPTLLPFFNTC